MKTGSSDRIRRIRYETVFSANRKTARGFQQSQITDNHSYNTPKEGATDWHLPLNDNFNRLDSDIEIRDVESNRTEYIPKQGAKFLSVDTGAIFLSDGDWGSMLDRSSAANTPTGSSSTRRVAFGLTASPSTADRQAKQRGDLLADSPASSMSAVSSSRTGAGRTQPSIVTEQP